MMIVMMIKKMQESDTENEVQFHDCDDDYDDHDHVVDHDDGDDSHDGQKDARV